MIMQQAPLPTEPPCLSYLLVFFSAAFYSFQCSNITYISPNLSLCFSDFTAVVNDIDTLSLISDYSLIVCRITVGFGIYFVVVFIP